MSGLGSLWPLVFRLGLGAMFLYASHDKILDPTGFAKIVYQWQVVGPLPANLVAVVLPWVEAISGTLLILGVWRREAALLAATMLLTFNLAAVSVLARGIDVENCGCTSVAAESREKSPFRGVGWFLLTRNSALLLAALVLVFAPAGGRAPEPKAAQLPALDPASLP